MVNNAGLDQDFYRLQENIREQMHTELKRRFILKNKIKQVNNATYLRQLKEDLFVIDQWIAGVGVLCEDSD